MSVKAIGTAIAVFIVLTIIGVMYVVLFDKPKSSPIIPIQQTIVQGQAKAAADTNGVVVSNTKTAVKTDTQTQENHRAIIAKPGAAQPASSDLDTAGRRAICLRKSAADLPECQRLRLIGSDGLAH